MPSTSTLFAFAAAAFLLVALPGPNIFYLLTRSIADGRRAGIVSALGLETGTLVHITAAAAGLALAAGSAAQRFRRHRGGRPWRRRASGCLYLAMGAFAALSPAQRAQ